MIARRVRECNVYCEVKPYTMTLQEIKDFNPIGIIFTGGPDSVYKENSYHPAEGIFELNIPILGICYGCQLLAHHLGGKVVAAGEDNAREYGKTITFYDNTCLLYEVEAAFRRWDIHLIRVDAKERFLNRLAGVTEPEQKRKIIGEEFIRVFEEEGKKIGQTDFLAQGTIYPDVIESGKENAETIKSHHNVGGLPDFVDFKEIIEPLRLLFKDEVRELGKQLKLPKYMVMRQPFPGPGLAIRIIGEVTEEKLEILREADAIFRDEIEKADLENSMNQYFAALTNMKSVGVMGDGRTYDWAIALRSVTTEDFMTADWTRIPYEVLDRVSSRIVNEVPHVNRVLYDITSKPPSTVEFE